MWDVVVRIVSARSCENVMIAGREDPSWPSAAEIPSRLLAPPAFLL